MIFLLVRHGQSMSNARKIDATHVGDHTVPLTPVGRQQLRWSGVRVKTLYPYFFDAEGLLTHCSNSRPTLRYRSPYLRTRESDEELIRGAEPVFYSELNRLHPTYEDPRLREVEWGYNKPTDHGDYVDEMRETHGKFYYRIEGGESPADCYDRISTFLETLMRQIKRKNSTRVLIVAHGLTLRCFAMRFMHLTVEQFDLIKNPKNGDIITITNEELTWVDDPSIKTVLTPSEIDQFSKPQFTYKNGCRNWRISGLRLPGDPQPRVYPWRCPDKPYGCGQPDSVWPFPEGNIIQADELSKCSKCDCGEKFYSV